MFFIDIWEKRGYEVLDKLKFKFRVCVVNSICVVKFLERGRL